MGLAGPKYRYELTRPREHLSHLLRAQGYQTVLFGHQHEAMDNATLGFDKTIREKQAGAVGIAAEVAAYLTQRRHDDPQPFFLQVAFLETHTPYLQYGGTPDSSRGVWMPPYMGGGHDEAALREHLAAFQGSIRQVDLAVAAILEALRVGGLEENTLVLFTVDHGPVLPRAKWTGFDAGAQVAGILRWPGGGLTGGRTCDLLLNNTDLFPTLLDLAGLSTPPDSDGFSFADTLRHPDKVPPEVRDEVFFSFFYSQTYAVRTRRHKFIRYFIQGCFNRPGFRQYGPAPAYEFFDLQSDPDELCDVAQDPAYAAIREEMNGRLWRHLERVNAPVLQGPVAYRPYELAMEAYRRRRGRWASDLSGVREKVYDGATATLSTNRHRIRREFNSIFAVTSALRLFDLAADPEGKTNRADDPAYAGVLAEMDAKLWTWLEQEQAPILAGLPAMPAIDEALQDYRRWREAIDRPPF